MSIPYAARALNAAHPDLANSAGVPARLANGRTNIGTVNLDAKKLKFAADGSLRLHLSHKQPDDKDAQANWLPAPEGQFALIVRTYVPTAALLNGNYELPDVNKN
jgi:hypothetical protein